MTNTINVTGTGGIIEGNLGAANVNVNLDSSLSFDGSDDNINIGDITVLDGDGSFTQTAWAKFASDGGGNQYIAWKDDAFGIALFSNFRIRGYIYYSGGNTNTQFEFPDTTNGPKGDGWIHIASSYDGSNLKLYVNGDLKDTVSLASKTIDNSTKDFKIGGIGSGTQFKGEIADVRLYSSTLTDAEIKTLASKINIANEVVQSTSTLVGWWKLNNNSITDSSTNSNNGTATGTTQVYDDYSVDVYDNSTTTDGTFTVTQGKVECKALSSVDFDGTDDHVDTSNTFLDNTDFTIACWIRHDGTQESGLGSIVDTRQSGGNGVALSNHKTDHIIRLRIGDGGVNDISTANDAVSDNTWHHIVAGRDASNNTFLYLDGVLQASGTSTRTLDSNTGLHIGGAPYTTAAEFGGKIRDVKLFDYGLSAEQAASLYSGTYPQTPSHHYKLDEGSGTTASDTGTATASNGTLTNSPTYSNGTLDLDGTLTIAANGTLSAPRGNLDLANIAFAKNASGTFTHNNGNVKFSTAGGSSITTSDPVLYDLEVNQGGSNLDVTTNLTIEHNLTVTSGMLRPQPDTKGSELTITFGTTSYASQLELDNYGIGFESGGNNTHACALVGVSSLYPFKVLSSSSAGIDLDSGGSSSKVKLANIDYDKDITSGGGGVTVTLTGDAEFNTFTVSGGDKLDLNGQRAEFSGNLSNQSTGSGNGVDYDGMLYFTGSGRMDSDGASENLDKLTLVQQGTSTSDADLASDGTIKTFFYNQPSVTQKNHRGAIQTIIGCGTATCGTSNSPDYTNLTVATGGTLDGSSSTLLVAGDFTTSGGLIGKSAVNFDDTDSNTTGFINCGSGLSDTVLDDKFDGGATLEAWIKPNSKGQNNNFGGMIASKVFWYFATRTDSGSNSCKLTFKQFFDGDDSEWTSTDFVIDYNKWSHVAVTYDSSDVANDVTMYVNGKQVAVTRTQPATGTRNSDASKDFFIGNYDDNDTIHFDGTIAMMRYFDDIRTVSEIRADMFNEHANMVDTGNLLAMWQFDEGSGTTIDNKGSVGAAADGTLTAGSVSGGWAGAGTFTYGTSTLNIYGSDSKIRTNSGGNDFFNIVLAPSGGTTTFEKVSDANVDIHGLLTHNGGTMAQSGNVYFTIKPTGMITAGATIPYIVYWQNTNDNVPSANFQFFISNTSTVTFGGNCTFTGYLRNLSGNTMVMGPFTHSVKSWVSSGTNTFDLRNSTINAISDGTWTEFRPKDSSTGTTTTLITGNTNINGHSSGCKWLSPPEMNCEIVGNVSNLIFQDAGEYSGYNNYANDITIVGSVTNCSGVGFRQFHHTLDTQQLLDADEAGDDDLKLEKPALDNAVELQTG